MSSIFPRKLGLNILFIAIVLSFSSCEQAPKVKPYVNTNGPAKDWPMWGGTPDRNMISDDSPVSLDFDLEENVNVVWSANLGSQTYGNPTVANGRVYVKTSVCCCASTKSRAR